MKKIKSVISLIKKSEKPFLTFLEILWIISQIPIIIIHEASHFLFIFLTGCKFKIDFERWKFISSDTVISDDGEPVIKMTRYTFPITLIGKNMIKKMIVALAPFFGIVVYLFLTFFIPICIIANPLTSIIICTIRIVFFSTIRVSKLPQNFLVTYIVSSWITFFLLATHPIIIDKKNKNIKVFVFIRMHNF